MTLINYYLPRPEDFFPKLRRGHGSIRPYVMTAMEGHKDLVPVLNKVACAAPGCKGPHDEKSVKVHFDKAANMNDWSKEHGGATV